jgi:antitoxin component YwqK of YwqJK toxin-antitoxin module
LRFAISPSSSFSTTIIVTAQATNDATCLERQQTGEDVSGIRREEKPFISEITETIKEGVVVGGILLINGGKHAMDRDTAYVSSIPKEAREKVTARYGKIGKKRAKYYIGKELVGIREFFITGEPEYERAFNNGIRHGMHYDWYDPGKLSSCAPYENGVAHGTAYQWGNDGKLIGSYTMERGTGIDLWWQDWSDGSAELAEVHYERDGNSHGFEWWLNSDGTLREERYWQEGIWHGIEREWNFEDGLRRGYPRYYVHGERVTKRQYVKACTTDTTLPPFRLEDNSPQRVFPPEIAVHLRP